MLQLNFFFQSLFCDINTYLPTDNTLGHVTAVQFFQGQPSVSSLGQAGSVGKATVNIYMSHDSGYPEKQLRYTLYVSVSVCEKHQRKVETHLYNLAKIISCESLKTWARVACM